MLRINYLLVLVVVDLHNLVISWICYHNLSQCLTIGKGSRSYFRGFMYPQLEQDEGLQVKEGCC